MSYNDHMFKRSHTNWCLCSKQLGSEEGYGKESQAKSFRTIFVFAQWRSAATMMQTLRIHSHRNWCTAINALKYQKIRAMCTQIRELCSVFATFLHLLFLFFFSLFILEFRPFLTRYEAIIMPRLSDSIYSIPCNILLQQF